MKGRDARVRVNALRHPLALIFLPRSFGSLRRGSAPERGKRPRMQREREAGVSLPIVMPRDTRVADTTEVDRNVRSVRFGSGWGWQRQRRINPPIR